MLGYMHFIANYAHVKRRRHPPAPISAMSNLAATLYEQDYFDEAIAMQQQVLEKMKRILDIDHPSTKQVAQNLTTMVQGREAPSDTVKSPSHEKRTFLRLPKWRWRK